VQDKGASSIEKAPIVFFGFVRRLLKRRVSVVSLPWAAREQADSADAEPDAPAVPDGVAVRYEAAGPCVAEAQAGFVGLHVQAVAALHETAAQAGTVEHCAVWAQDVFPAGLAPSDGSQGAPAESDAFEELDALAACRAASAAAQDGFQGEDSQAEPAEPGELVAGLPACSVLAAPLPVGLLLDDPVLVCPPEPD
jgi:hypothetical protein